MRAFQALYNPDVHDSAYCTLSIHLTREGAEKAIKEHSEKELIEFIEYQEKLGEEASDLPFAWDKDWLVEEIQIQGNEFNLLTILFRLIALPPFMFITLIGVIKWLLVSNINFIRFGGEAISYSKKLNRKTITDVFYKLKKIQDYEQ
jgi:hypothetical protein